MWKNAKNLHFWAFWAKMANFGQFSAKIGKTGIFFKKAFGTFFSLLKALINCKVSEKSKERFSSNSVTDVRTDARTHRRTWILRSPTTSSRDQKGKRETRLEPVCWLRQFLSVNIIPISQMINYTEHVCLLYVCFVVFAH